MGNLKCRTGRGSGREGDSGHGFQGEAESIASARRFFCNRCLLWLETLSSRAPFEEGNSDEKSNVSDIQTKRSFDIG